jgi:drug/metabolite transporter (DMT)-like permease
MSVTAVTPDTRAGAFGLAPSFRARRGLSDASQGYAQIVMASALFGLAGSVAKVALDAGIDPARLTALRCTGAAIGLLVVIGLTRPSLLRVSRRDIPMLLMLALCGAAAIQWLYFVAIDRLPVGLALLLEFTAPLMVALFSRFVLRHQIDRRVWLGLGLALVGLALVAQMSGGGVWGGGDLDPIGVAAALGAAGCLAAFYLGGKQALQRLHPMTLTFWMFALSAAFWAVAQPWWTFEFGVLTQDASMLGSLDAFSVPLWVPIAWVVLLGTLMPYAFELASLNHLSPTATSVVAMSEPVIAAAIAWAWLGEELGTVQIIGAGVVLSGVVIVQLFSVPDETRNVADVGLGYGRTSTVSDGSERLRVAGTPDAGAVPRPA